MYFVIHLATLLLFLSFLSWYIRKQVRVFHLRISTTIARTSDQQNIIASGQAAALLSSRFSGAYMPVSDFTINPVNMQALLARVESEQPRLIVELGGGYSTLVLAHAVAAWGGRIVSFDQDENWQQLCLQHLELAGVSEQVLLEQLRPDTDPRSVLDRVDPGCMIDFLIIDGPYDPEKVGLRQREAARFLPHLSDTGTIYLDDAKRPLEQSLLRWLEREHGKRVEERVSSSGFAFASRE
jgi:predicted O-methyltransferase YrrM